MLRLACIGDLHLHRASPRYAPTLSVLDWTIADALQRGATGFVLLGDVVESAPAPMEIADLAQRFGAIRDGGAWVAVVQGNHEHPETGAIWEALGVVSAWDRFRFVQTPEALVMLCPYPRRGRPPFDDLKDDGTIAGNMQAAAERITDAIEAEREELGHNVPLVVLGHVTVQGMTCGDSTYELHANSEVLVPQSAFTGCALTAVGHIHAPQDVSADPPIIGVGSLVRHSFSEREDSKSYTLVTIKDGHVIHERIPVPAREMRQLNVTWPCAAPLEELYSVADECAGKEVKLVVDIPADQVATFDPSAFDAIKARAALFVLEKRVIPVERVRAPAINAAQGVRGEFAAWLDTLGDTVDAAQRERLLGKLEEIA